MKIPAKYLELCENWHSGQYSMLYAISSTGELECGTIRPRDCSNEEWLLTLVESAIIEIEGCIRISTQSKDEFIAGDLPLLEDFLSFMENKCSEMMGKLVGTT